MTGDQFERHLQALLDGQPLSDPRNPHDAVDLPEPLRMFDALARAHRIALFGTDVAPDRPVTRWGHLEIRNEIGRGASGTVYRAWDPRLAREVALKLLASDSQTEAALEEGRLLARLNDPYIVRVFGADAHDGVSGVWMELLEGDTLEHVLARDGVYGAEESAVVGMDLARAVASVHAAGLLHRDIKARNVLRERGGRVVLMDLGAGRSATDIAQGSETGTPMYMAPELFDGQPASVRSDVYSLGVLLYHLLTNRFPVRGRDLEQLRAEHHSASREPLLIVRTNLPSDLVSAVERACHPDPSARFGSALELYAALSDAMQTMTRRTLVGSTLSRALRRRKHDALAVLALLLVTLGGTWAAWETEAGRVTRRWLGWQVGPRSTLYLTTNGGMIVVRGTRAAIVAGNPTTASPIAASADLGVLTMVGMAPWTAGARYRLDGTPVAPPPTINAGLCCLYDGTTDGRFNYVVRQDSTLLEPADSRPLAPPALYRFERDWSDPRLQFLVAPDGMYFGVTYSAHADSFWLTRQIQDEAVIEQWSHRGQHLATPVRVPAAVFAGIAADPSDGTLWVTRQQLGGSRFQLANYDTSGQLLGTLDLERLSDVGASGAEFAWVQQP